MIVGWFLVETGHQRIRQRPTWAKSAVPTFSRRPRRFLFPELAGRFTASPFCYPIGFSPLTQSLFQHATARAWSSTPVVDQDGDGLTTNDPTRPNSTPTAMACPIPPNSNAAQTHQHRHRRRSALHMEKNRRETNPLAADSDGDSSTTKPETLTTIGSPYNPGKFHACLYQPQNSRTVTTTALVTRSEFVRWG